MRNWAATFGLVGGVLSTAFWAWVPFSHSNNIYTQPGLEPLYVAFIIMSIGGVLGALIAGVSDRWSPLLMGIAVIPALGAVFVPGLLLAIATLLAVHEPFERDVRATRAR
ncbi:MAG: hypothetical protein E6I70_01525 [Chloroflexi bacterium]|nr:MAG: hypothetical protein E6I63_00260 [Chloroflexota bacterium]TME20375.1 MAG: hypothetical protein E6I70_01525 [Chloroflexota bacterium]